MSDLDNVLALARHENIAIKISGLPALSMQTYPFRDVHDTAHRLFDAFGPQRSFWGTDLTRMTCTYRECIDLFMNEMSWLSGTDLEWVMGRGVMQFLKAAKPIA
jgi:predicted TIM-barrel fold metal-dependent hydrolase